MDEYTITIFMNGRDNIVLNNQPKVRYEEFKKLLIDGERLLTFNTNNEYIIVNASCIGWICCQQQPKIKRLQS